MIAKWLSDTIRDFGRRLGLRDFALNARGVAAVQFEDGTRFMLECAGEKVFVLMEFPCEQPSVETLKALLTEAHPLRKGVFAVRAAYRDKAQMLLLVTALREELVDEPTLGNAFDELWKRLAGVRRTLWA